MGTGEAGGALATLAHSAQSRKEQKSLSFEIVAHFRGVVSDTHSSWCRAVRRHEGTSQASPALGKLPSQFSFTEITRTSAWPGPVKEP